MTKRTNPVKLHLLTEHYPNPYKPWIDTQVSGLMDRGVQVDIFAFGGWGSSVNDIVTIYGTADRTTYLPATTRGVLGSLDQLVSVVGRDPALAVERVRSAQLTRYRPLSQPAVAARAVMMPAEPPSACLIHDLGPASRMRFLRTIYPKTRICVSYNGGEVAGMPQVENSEEIFRDVDHVIGLSEFAREEAVARGCTRDKTSVVPLGFDVDRFTPKSDRRYRSDGTLRLISIGRLSPEKGISTALTALGKLKNEGMTDVEYTIVGTGIAHEELKRMSARLRIEDMVTFLGEIPGHRVPEVLETKDVLLLPSLVTETWAETQATVVQEALLMKCIAVTTATGALPETNAPAMHQYFFEPGDPEALAAVLRTVNRLSPNHLRELGEHGRQFVLDKFDADETTEQIYKILFCSESPSRAPQ